MGNEYVMGGMYPGDVTLIKRSQTTSPDCRLSEACEGHVNVINVDADHRSIIVGENAQLVADVIKTMI